MTEHPLIAYIEDLDKRLDKIINRQKYLHSASVLGLTTDEQNKDIRKLDKRIEEVITYRNLAQKILFDQTRLVILHNWEWDL